MKGGGHWGFAPPPPPLEALPPTCPPSEEKWSKSAIFANFLIFAPSEMHFSPSMPPQKISGATTAHEDYISDVNGQSLSDENPKKFYSYLKLKTTENINIPVLSSNGRHCVTDSSEAEALSAQCG